MVVDIYRRIAPLREAVIGAASLDSAVAAQLRTVEAGRKAGLGRFVARIDDLGGQRADLNADRATDLLFVLHGHETFLGLVVVAGWPVAEFKARQYQLLCRALLTDASVSATGEPTRDLSFHAAWIAISDRERDR